MVLLHELYYSQLKALSFLVVYLVRQSKLSRHWIEQGTFHRMYS